MTLGLLGRAIPSRFHDFNGGGMRLFRLMRQVVVGMCACGVLTGVAHAQASDMAERVKPCVSCHGENGRAGPDGYYPRLAGKPAGYLLNQMQNFSHGRRRYLMMRRMMEPLSLEYQREMAQYFSELKVPYAAPSIAKALSSEQAARGRALATQGDATLHLPACESCHGQGLTGQGNHIPSLVGLPAAYLSAQLSAWRTGDRQTQVPDCMAEIAKRLRSEDVHAVVGWISEQPVLKSIEHKSMSVAQRNLPDDLRCGSAPELHGRAP